MLCVSSDDILCFPFSICTELRCSVVLELDFVDLKCSCSIYGSAVWQCRTCGDGGGAMTEFLILRRAGGGACAVLRRTKNTNTLAMKRLLDGPWLLSRCKR